MAAKTVKTKAKSKKTPVTITSVNPDLKSVLLEMEEAHYFFVIADRKKANLFLIKNDKIEKKKRVMHPGVRKTIKTNSGELYGKNTKIMHKIEHQVHDHLALIMQEAKILIKDAHLNGVFIGGHQPFFHEIEAALPKHMQKILRGKFVTELNIEEEALVNHCKKALQKYLK